jgi:hypothetical protein
MLQNRVIILLWREIAVGRWPFLVRIERGRNTCKQPPAAILQPQQLFKQRENIGSAVQRSRKRFCVVELCSYFFMAQNSGWESGLLG